MKKILIGLITIGVLGLGTTIYLSKPAPAETAIPDVDKDEPFSTLTCAGGGATAALENIRNEYERAGDIGAFRAALVHIDNDVCKYNTESVYWINKDYADHFPGFEAYVDVPCKALTNGHCLAIQPVYLTDEADEKVTWSGYMLVEPRGDTSSKATVAARLQKGLILNRNY